MDDTDELAARRQQRGACQLCSELLEKSKKIDAGICPGCGIALETHAFPGEKPVPLVRSFISDDETAVLICAQNCGCTLFAADLTSEDVAALARYKVMVRSRGGYSDIGTRICEHRVTLPDAGTIILKRL